MFVYGEANRDLPYLSALRRGELEVEEIPHSDHFPIYSNPQRFFAVLSSFLRKYGKRW